MVSKDLIFLHGGPGFCDYLEPYFGDLNSSYRCVFYDQLRGPNVRIDDLILQLDELVRATNSPVLVGHSWGGVLATEYLSRYEGKVTGLVLMSSLLSASQWTEYRKDLQRLGLTNLPWDDLFFAMNDPVSERERLTKIFQDFSEETFDSLFGTYLRSFDLTNVISKLTIPTHNIFGAQDFRCPLRVAKAFKICNSSIQDHEMEGAGHFPFLQPGNREKIHGILRSLT